MSYYSDSEFVNDPNTPWNKVLKLIPSKSKVLDIGCSSGNFDEVIFEKKQATVDGIELDKKDAEIAGQKLHKVFNLNIETDNLDLPDNYYDIIYFGDIIEHLQFPVQALKKVKRFLNQNGSVIFSIPNMAHISVRLMLLAGKFEYGNTGLLDKTHLHYYDKAEIYRVFSEAGYKIEQLDWSSRDLPKELIEKELDKIGLKGSDKFFDLAKSLEAGAYQFIGRAVPSSVPVKTVPRPKISPAIDMFEKHLADIRKSYVEEVCRINKQNESRNIEFKQLSKQVNELTKRINEYDNSLSWKITKPLRKVSKIIK